jgi:magnesium and cobalt transporter
MKTDPVEPPSTGNDWIRRLRRIVRGGPANRDELFDELQQARERDLIDQDALDTIERVIQVSELRVRDVMIPRAQVVVVDKSQSPEEVLPVVIHSAHSRFPVTDGDRDRVVGILLAKDLLRYFHERATTDFAWRDLLRPAVFIPESKRLNVLLSEFRISRNHMAIVVDEYGGVAGLVTIEDVIEQIVGDIEDEHDIDEEAGMVMQRDDNLFVVKALLPIEDFNERMGTDFDDSEFDTVGGMVVHRLGHVPRRGERLELPGFLFEVLNADSRRVHLLRVTRRPTT